MYPTNTVIQLAQISQYLASNAIYLGIEKDKQLANKLYIERKSVEWAYGIDPTDASLVKTSNYLYTMCGAYAFEALGIIGSGGGVVPSPSGGGGTGLIPYPITVTISSSQAGSMTLTNPDWIGLQDVNLVVINQSSFQSGAQFTFSPLNGTFDFSLVGYILQKNDVLTSLGFYTP